MIKSMTGFGRGTYSDGRRNVIVEIRAVNHRYCDITVKMPRRYAFAEEKIKGVVRERLSRGKIDVSVVVENTEDCDVDVSLNAGLARAYYESLEALQATLPVAGDITLPLLASFPDVLRTVPAAGDEEELTQAVLRPTMQAVEALEAMRVAEGEKLAADLLRKADRLEAILEEIRARAPQVRAGYAEKLRERIRELLGDSVDIPQDRILVEAAIFADKCAIDEEITRLASHIGQFRTILADGSHPEGKKLDFLVQEMNREANTIGSKANDLTLTGCVLEMKSEIEKIREQVQNVE